VSETKTPHCGNCKHFHGEPHDSHGFCFVMLPTWMPFVEGKDRIVHRAHSLGFPAYFEGRTKAVRVAGAVWIAAWGLPPLVMLWIKGVFG